MVFLKGRGMWFFMALAFLGLFFVLWSYPFFGVALCSFLIVASIFNGENRVSMPTISLDLRYMGPNLFHVSVVFIVMVLSSLFFALFFLRKKYDWEVSVLFLLQDVRFYFFLEKALFVALISLSVLYFCWGVILLRRNPDVLQKAKGVAGSRALWTVRKLFLFTVVSFMFLYLLGRVVGFIFLDLLGFNSGGLFSIDDLIIVLFSMCGYFFVWYFLLLTALGFVFGVLVRLTNY